MGEKIGVRVAAVITLGDDVFIMERNTKKGTQYSFPGGNVEDGELISDAIVREIYEELGIKLSDFRPLFLQDMMVSRDGYNSYYRKCHIVFTARVSEENKLSIANSAHDDLYGENLVRRVHYKNLLDLHLYPSIGRYIALADSIEDLGPFRMIEPMTDKNFIWR